MEKNREAGYSILGLVSGHGQGHLVVRWHLNENLRAGRPFPPLDSPSWLPPGCALHLSSAWNALLQDLCLASSFASFLSQLRDDFPDHRV